MFRHTYMYVYIYIYICIYIYTHMYIPLPLEASGSHCEETTLEAPPLQLILYVFVFFFVRGETRLQPCILCVIDSFIITLYMFDICVIRFMLMFLFVFSPDPVLVRAHHAACARRIEHAMSVLGQSLFQRTTL